MCLGCFLKVVLRGWLYPPWNTSGPPGIPHKFDFLAHWSICSTATVLSSRGGFSHWHGIIRICACLLGHFFAKFGIAIGGFSSETKEPKLHNLGVFWANYCKKHPIWSKLGAFLSKMVYWWVRNLAKNWYRDSQIFEVRQAHPRTILVKELPPPRDYHIHFVCVLPSTTVCYHHTVQSWYALHH